jgi:hypothetical protein
VRNDTTGKLLKGRFCSWGYYQVILNKNGKPKPMNIHRLAANAFISNPNNQLCVDHIDNNKLNNNITNLRWVTTSENCQNKSMSTLSTSGVKGVYWNKNRNKWRAYIKIDAIDIHLGYFINLEDAKKARLERANKEFGVYMNSCEKQ